jgi:glutamate synthase (ferredoxin)
MNNYGLPGKQGLYDPNFEHDACGIGFVVNIKGNKSHEIIRQAIQILINLTHRGGSGAESNTGDGAGILVQIPHDFFMKECKAIDIMLPVEGQYGVGMIFMPQDTSKRQDLIGHFDKVILEEGLTLLGWRDVPIDDSSIGKTAKAAMPFMRQVFIGHKEDEKSELDFERKLYVVRKLMEKYACEKNEYFYAASLSSKTIVYKGMLTAQQVDEFYKDLADPLAVSSLALVHSRYSTNTFPSWERAHPNRYIIHNGEINTLRGNVNWMNARQHVLKTKVFGDNFEKIIPIINNDGSDSAMFDNCLEFLTLAGRPISHAVSMMIPEPWSNHESMNEEKKAFYEFSSCLMEPWDGPAAIAFTDGTKIGAVLDRNGLRPARYYVTSDDLVILSSEVGVLDVPPEKIICKERLHPGKMLLIDTKEGRILSDEEIKHSISSEYPYRAWLDKNLIYIH